MGHNRQNNYCTFYIVRHGETDWNVKKIVQGQTDIPLNQNGLTQADNLAKNLKRIKFDKVFSSDLLRAKRTAEIISLEHQLVVETTETLRERRFGHFEGQPSIRLKEADAILEKLSKEQAFSYKLSGEIESDEELITRFITFLREVAIVYPRKNILIVTHGGIMRTFIDYLIGSFHPVRQINNTAYLKIGSDGSDFYIKGSEGIDMS